MEYPSGEGARRESKMVLATITVLVLTVVTLAFMFTRRKSVRGKLLPPGPNGWPVVGSLPLLSKLPHRSLQIIANEYGPLVFMHLGSVPTLVVSNALMAKEILKTCDAVFCSRPHLIIQGYLTYNRQNIAFAPYGPYWRRVRKVSTMELFTTARIFQFQSIRQSEILDMLQSIFKEYERGSSLHMYDTLSNLTMNVMTKMLWKKSYFGAKGPKADAAAVKFKIMLRDASELVGASNMADYIPILKPLCMILQGYDKRMKDSHHDYDLFFQTVIDDHLKANPIGTKGKESADFVDVLLKQTQTADPISMDSVKAILWDVLNGGTETSAATLEWAIVELIRHPVMMCKVQDELNAVAGPNRLPTESDIPDLKYLNAVIKETLRLHPPFSLYPRESIQDCEVAGYHIPGGSLVFLNLHAIHRDPEVWERPLEFDPDRFLKPSGDIDVKGLDFELIPFGSGRRICPGMNLALRMVQTSLAQLLHAFEWSVPGDVNPEEIDMSERFGNVCPKAVSLTVFTKPRLAAHVIFPASG